MKRRLLALMLSATLALGALTACGGGGTDTGTDTGASPGGTLDSSPAASP